MASALGDIFWDLPPWIVYTPGFDLGCSIYVANPTEVEKEYALIGRLSQDTTLISEEALPVFGTTWFKVEPGDFVVLRGALRFDETDADLAVQLIERETEEATDSVSTRLVAPTTAVLPPAWPPGVPAPTDWMGMLLPVVMMAMLGMVMVSAFRPKEKKEVTPPIGEKKLLPPGRGE
jgi:hypothetical protein